MDGLKRLITIVMAAFVSLFAMARLNNEGSASAVARGIQTQAVYYRDGSFDQPLIGAKMVLGSASQPFNRLYIQLSKKTDPSILSQFKLYKTSVNYFAPARATELTGNGKVKVTVKGRTICFDFWNTNRGASPEVANGDTLWVTARVAKEALPGVEIDAQIMAVQVAGKACVVENRAPKGRGRTYEFRRHVVPYYRMARTGNWNDAYYEVVSEVIFFYMGVNGNGTLYYGWEGGQYNEEKFRESLERLRDGRPKGSAVRIMLGLAHCASGLSAATRNDAARATLVDQIVHYVEKFGFDGVDIDWEYPNSASDWRGFEKLLAELRPRLFALDNGQMISSAMSNYKLPESVNAYGLSKAELMGLHQQFDFFNTMTYDNGSMDGHSPWWLHQQSKQICAQWAGLPPIKSCIGVPFYTNRHDPSKSKWNNLTWEQMGYDWIYYTYPQYMDATDTFWYKGHLISYNSIATIRKKGLDLREGGYGVMIWGYECDIPYSNPKSLARALASTIRPTDDYFVDNPNVDSAAAWERMAGGNYRLTADVTLTADDCRPFNFTGTLDGQGHTVTLKGGAAAIPGGFGGKIKNVTFVVDGALTAMGAITDRLEGKGRLENVTVIVKRGASISGPNAVGALVGEIWAADKNATACVKTCVAEVYGTLTATGHGRVGGLVGNLNLGYESKTEPARLQGCRAEIHATATLLAPQEATHSGVGGLFGNGNTARECARDNMVVIYKGATLSAPQRVAIVTPGNMWGKKMKAVRNNRVFLERGVNYDFAYASRVMEFTIGAVDRKTRTAPVEFYDRSTGKVTTSSHAVRTLSTGTILRFGNTKTTTTSRRK